MITVKVYNGPKLIAKSKKYSTFKKAYSYAIPYVDNGMRIEIHGKRKKV